MLNLHNLGKPAGRKAKKRLGKGEGSGWAVKPAVAIKAVKPEAVAQYTPGLKVDRCPSSAACPNVGSKTHSE